MPETVRPDGVYPPYAIRVIDELYNKPEDDKKREGYAQRGLIPTNNLRLYLNEDAPLELAPGIVNLNCYKNREFAPIIEQFRLSNPQLWQKRRDYDDLRGTLVDMHVNLLKKGQPEEAAELNEALDEAYWLSAEATDKIFRIVAPQLEAAGFDPLDLCR